MQKLTETEMEDRKKALIAQGNWLTKNYKAAKSAVSSVFGGKSERDKCQSKPERMLFDALYPVRGYGPLKSQYEIGPYFADLCYPSVKVVVEVDGYEYHHTKEQRNDDLKRQRFIQAQGWLVIRFSGSDIYRSAAACVAEIERIIEGN